jgi:uncharacterized protein involved in exopolysaccharide biosynthesis
MGDRDRLQALLVDYRRKSAVYQSGHPDLVRLEREIEILRQSVGGTEAHSLLQEQLRQERDRLTGLRDRYSDNHPDIKNSEATIRKLESQLAFTDPSNTAFAEAADNPAYILIKTQLQSVELDMTSQRQKQQQLQATIDEHESLIRMTPRIEGEYQKLLRAVDNASTKYADLQGKLRAADVAADVEEGITGRRFTVLEPPVVPVDSEPRNRLIIVFLGILLAGGFGLGAAAFAEAMDTTIRSPKVLSNTIGMPILAVIPYLDNTSDLTQARNRRLLLLSTIFAVTALYIVYFLYL